ncbi:sigma factor G inhibitor Gin [Clostridium sp. BJN0001]|uniref:sigma factor G inhibitor Gin n=1 Tax=Clostridium sp. BJN0001 TaxID=2930219 RepID=UPI001FD0C043|nr:sigma factor G inhibitor Gin [Clostridium sp. BJN0001]
MKKTGNLCFICRKKKSNGIIINGDFICRDCEKDLISKTPYDDGYDKNKDKIKVILYN